MNKNIKKIISTIIITMSLFAIVGCGESKEIKDIKEENVTQNQTQEEEVTTKEDIVNFEELYKKYWDLGITLTKFKLDVKDKDYITIEKSKELKVEYDKVRDVMLEKTPKELKESVSNSVRLREEYFKAYYENREQELGMSFMDETNKYSKETKTILEKLHTQLDNK